MRKLICAFAVCMLGGCGGSVSSGSRDGGSTTADGGSAARSDGGSVDSGEANVDAGLVVSEAGHCGGDGQPCCDIGVCASPDLLCLTLQSGGTCTSHCGGIGQPCCQQNYEDQGTLLCKNGGVCLENAQILLPPNTLCFDPSTCGFTAGQCTTCGLPGQPCCAGGLCVPGAAQCLGAGGGQIGTCDQGPDPGLARRH